MPYDFDRIIDRRASNSIKWGLYGADVLPLWVADMDFSAPPAICAALESAVRHGIFGYEFPSKKLREIVAARMFNLFNWQVSPEAVIATPGVIAGFIAAAHTACSPGEGVLIQPPVYPPFVSLHTKVNLISQQALLEILAHDHLISYRLSLDEFTARLDSQNAHTGMFLLCNPHNPTGQVFTRSELESMANLCLKNKTVICSDEIHSELLLGDAVHVPIASLSEEIASQVITLIAPSKTFNVPGLFCGFAIIPDRTLREKFTHVMESLAMHVNSLGLIAAQAAFSGECDDWLAAVRRYLLENRDFLVETIRQNLPGMKTTLPNATYLAWLDCRELDMPPSPFQFCLERARVALNNGSEFGPGGKGFLRMNFACPRKILVDALERILHALAEPGNRL